MHWNYLSVTRNLSTLFTVSAQIFISRTISKYFSLIISWFLIVSTHKLFKNHDKDENFLGTIVYLTSQLPYIKVGGGVTDTYRK